MTIIAERTHTTAPAPAVETGRTLGAGARKVLALLRMAFGLTFLWAFADKALALGFATGRDAQGHIDRFGDAAWIHGGSPTEGFLKFAAKGPFEGLYHSLAGVAVVDWLFMAALLGIGLSLTLGIAMRLGTASGVLLYLMMWTVVMPPETNPVIDDHILGALTLIVLGLTGAGATWGLARRWNSTGLVRRHRVLR
jgi:thiosulfate dehydrogenase (quinone) large subunit